MAQLDTSKIKTKFSQSRVIYLTYARLPSLRAYAIGILKMCEALAEAGAKVTLIVPKQKHLPKIRDINKYYGIRQQFELIYVKCFDLFNLEGKIPHIFFVILYTLSRLFFICHALPYVARIKRDIIYTRDPLCFFVLLLVKPLLRTKVAIELHTPVNRFFWALLRHTDLCFTTTNALKQYLKIDKAVVLADGVDLELFSEQDKDKARTALNIDKAAKVVCYCGHLYENKGIYTLIESKRYLDDSVKIYLVGGLDYYVEKVKDYIARNKIDGVEVCGHVPHAKVVMYLSSADVIVLPYSAKDIISAQFVSPLKLFEGMAIRRPIVAAAVPSIFEILDDNDAFFFEPDSPVALACAIKTILNNPNLAQQLTKNAYNKVKNYTWRARAEKILTHLTQQS